MTEYEEVQAKLEKIFDTVTIIGKKENQNGFVCFNEKTFKTVVLDFEEAKKYCE